MCSELDSISPRIGLCKDPSVVLDFEKRSAIIKQSARIVEEEILTLNYLKSSGSLSREEETIMQKAIINNFVKVSREAYSLDEFFKKLHKIAESSTLSSEAAATVITQAVVAGCTGNFSVAMGAGSVAGGILVVLKT